LFPDGEHEAGVRVTGDDNDAFTTAVRAFLDRIPPTLNPDRPSRDDPCAASRLAHGGVTVLRVVAHRRSAVLVSRRIVRSARRECRHRGASACTQI
jgi:hypothetical protein